MKIIQNDRNQLKSRVVQILLFFKKKLKLSANLNEFYFHTLLYFHSEKFMFSIFHVFVGSLEVKRTVMENMNVNIIGLVLCTNFSHYIEEHTKQTSNDIPYMRRY